MSAPYHFTPRVPAAPHSTPLSVSAYTRLPQKATRAPIHNPYDKFTQPEFDAWIGGITGALRKALGQVDEENPKDKATLQIEDDSLSYPDLTTDFGLNDEPADDSFAEIKVRRRVIRKGKARDPREGPGLGVGNRDQPIELGSSSEEEDDSEDEEDGDEEDELSHIFDEAASSDVEDYWEQGQTSAHRLLEKPKVQPGRYSVDEDEEDEEEGDEEELLSSHDESDGEAENHLETEEIIEIISDDELADDNHAGISELFEEGEEEGRGREAQFEGSEAEYSDNDEGYMATFQPLVSSNIRRPVQVDAEADFEEIEVEAETDQLMEDNKEQPLESDTSFPPHGTEQDEPPLDIPDPWEGPQTYAEDFYAGGDARVMHARHPNPHFLEESDVNESHEEDEIQPMDNDTSFPSHPASTTEVLPAIEILNPWAGPETYAEDYYAGGNIKLVPGQNVDLNHLGQEDDDLDQFFTAADNDEPSGSGYLEVGDRLAEEKREEDRAGDDIAGRLLVPAAKAMTSLRKAESVEVINVDSNEESTHNLKNSMEVAKSHGNGSELVFTSDVGAELETVREVERAHGEETVMSPNLFPTLSPAAAPSEDKVISRQFITTGEENAPTFVASESVETAEQTPVARPFETPHENVKEVVSELDTHRGGEDVNVAVLEGEEPMLPDKEPETEASPLRKEDEEIMVLEEGTSVVQEHKETDLNPAVDIYRTSGGPWRSEPGRSDEPLLVAPTSSPAHQHHLEQFEQLPASSTEPHPIGLREMSGEPTEIFPSQNQDLGPSLDEGDSFDRSSPNVEIETQEINIQGYTVIEDEGSVTSEDADGDLDLEVDILSVCSTDYRRENDEDFGYSVEEPLTDPEARPSEEPAEQAVDIRAMSVDPRDDLNDLDATPHVPEDNMEEASVPLETESPYSPDAHQVEMPSVHVTEEKDSSDSATIIDTMEPPAPLSMELPTPAAPLGFAILTGPSESMATTTTIEPEHNREHPSKSPSAPNAHQQVTDFIGDGESMMSGPDSARPDITSTLQAWPTAVPDSSLFAIPSIPTGVTITFKPTELFLSNDPYPYSLSTPGVASFIDTPKDKAPEEEDTEQDNSMSSSSTFDKDWENTYLNHIPDDGDIGDLELQYPTEPGLWSEADPVSPLSTLGTVGLPPSARIADAMHAVSGDVPESDRDSITLSRASRIEYTADEDPFRSMATGGIFARGKIEGDQSTSLNTESSQTEETLTSPVATSFLANGASQENITSTSAIPPKPSSASPEVEQQVLPVNPLDVDDVYNSGHGSKRKRGSSPLPSRLTRALQSKSTGIKQSAKEKTNEVGKETDEETIRVNPRPKGKGKSNSASKEKARNPSVISTGSLSSSGASSAARFLHPDNQMNSPASSVVSSAASDTVPMTIHQSPTVYKPSAMATRPAIPPNPLFHAHGQKRKQTLQPLPTRVIQQPSQHQTPIAPSLSRLHEQPPATSTSLSTTSTNLPASSALPPPPPPTPLPVKSSNSPVTRSHCRYHKISIPKEEGGPRVCFLVPGCSLNDKELMEDEEIEDHGDATHEDSLRMVKDVETLDFDAYLIGTLRQLVGLDILREQEVFYLPSPGEEVTRKVLRRSTSERTGLARNTSTYDSFSFAGSPGHSIRSPASTRAPASVAGSSTSLSALRRIDSDKESITTAHLSDSDSHEDEFSDYEFPSAKRSRPSPADEKGEGGSMGPPGPKPPKSRRRKRHVIDSSPYQPKAENEANLSNDDSKVPRKPQVKKRGVKRTRTNEVTEGEDRKAKKHKPRPKKTTVDTRTDSHSPTPRPPALQQPSPHTPSMETDGLSVENRLPDPVHNAV